MPFSLEPKTCQAANNAKRSYLASESGFQGKAEKCTRFPKQAAHSVKTVKGKDQQTGVLSLRA